MFSLRSVDCQHFRWPRKICLKDWIHSVEQWGWCFFFQLGPRLRASWTYWQLRCLKTVLISYLTRLFVKGNWKLNTNLQYYFREYIFRVNMRLFVFYGKEKNPTVSNGIWRACAAKRGLKVECHCSGMSCDASWFEFILLTLTECLKVLKWKKILTWHHDILRILTKIFV